MEQNAFRQLLHALFAPQRSSPDDVVGGGPVPQPCRRASAMIDRRGRAGVIFAFAGVVLTVSAGLFLARDTRRRVAAGTKDPGLRGDADSRLQLSSSGLGFRWERSSFFPDHVGGPTDVRCRHAAVPQPGRQAAQRAPRPRAGARGFSSGDPARSRRTRHPAPWPELAAAAVGGVADRHRRRGADRDRAVAAAPGDSALADVP